MNSKPTAAALFDLDGVLLDTEGTYTEIWSGIDRAIPTGVEGFAQKIKGTTLENILNTYYPDRQVQQRVVRMLVEAEEAMHYRLFDGVTDFLEDLRAHGIPCAIVTSSGDAKMAQVFAQNPGFGDFFDDVVTDSRVTRSKPDPQGYIIAAESLGVAPSESYVFEDSFNGVRAGRAAGATVIALATTNPAEELRLMAHAVIEDFTGFTVAKMLAVRQH